MIDDSALFHGGAYDPQKAHDYYMRTRKLKGRQPGAGRPVGPGRPAGRAVAGGGKPNRSKTKSRRAQLQAEKKHLEARLEHLKKVLEELVAAAKKRSGVKEHHKAKESHHDKADRNSKEKGKSPKLTQHQKRVKAQKAKKAYEKEHPNSLSNDVDILHEQIKDIRAKIEKALADARHRKTAGKNDSKSGSKNHR